MHNLGTLEKKINLQKKIRVKEIKLNVKKEGRRFVFQIHKECQKKTGERVKVDNQFSRDRTC